MASSRLREIFHRLGQERPKIVGETERKKGKKAARKQLIAIAFSKLRRGE